MKTSVMSIKVSKETKEQAQAVAKQFGVPLSTLVNAYLMELGATGQIHFGSVEVMTPKMEQIIEQAEQEILGGEVSPTFSAAEKVIESLDK